MVKFKDISNIMNNALLYAGTLTMLYTFMLAYLHESKTVLVSINSLGEANLEFIVLIIFTINMIINLIIKMRLAIK